MSTRAFLAAGASLLVAGCAIPPVSSIGTPIGRVEPLHYCAGDRLNVTNGIFAPPAAPCRDAAGHLCTDILPPRVTYRATPADFPEQVIQAQNHDLTFVPTGDAVDVQFLLDPNPFGMNY